MSEPDDDPTAGKGATYAHMYRVLEALVGEQGTHLLKPFPARLTTGGHASPLDEPWTTYLGTHPAHFRSLRVKSYRRLHGTVLDAPARINVIAGINNTGKTSLLEAIHLLCHQADPREMFDLIRRRLRRDALPDARHLVELLPHEIQISGSFADTPAVETALRATLATEPAKDETDIGAFAGTLTIEAGYGDQTQRTVTRLTDDDRPRTTLKEGSPRWLCRAAFACPFSTVQPALLRAAWRAAAAEPGLIDRVVAFLRDHLTPGLRDIQQVTRRPGDERFILTHDDTPPMDLALFGSGTQRAFQIALMFALARGGVVLVDEFENALHHKALHDFARLVYALAETFDVQVFLTTHSQEVVDAWAELVRQEKIDLVAYTLQPPGAERPVERISGERLVGLIDAIHWDIRG